MKKTLTTLAIIAILCAGFYGLVCLIGWGEAFDLVLSFF